MPNDRLDALRRQRSLVAQHLAWLDAEIAAADGPREISPAGGPAPAPPAPIPPLPAPGNPEAANPDAAKAPPTGSEEEKLALANARAAAILEEYAATDRFNPEATRRGCFLFALAVFLFGVAGLLAIYVFGYR